MVAVESAYFGIFGVPPHSAVRIEVAIFMFCTAVVLILVFLQTWITNDLNNASDALEDLKIEAYKSTSINELKDIHSRLIETKKNNYYPHGYHQAMLHHLSGDIAGKIEGLQRK